MKTKLMLMSLLAFCTGTVSAQLSSNPDKFLGNITTSGQVNYNGVEFVSLWDQLTPENESKWQSCEWTKDNFSWNGCDACYNYCKKNNIPFKFHCLAWGAQYPSWMDELSTTDQYKQYIEWIDAVARRYPDIDMIDVVNEAIPGHQPAPFKDALGGDGATGYDWIINCFRLAHERWPEAILIYNDYNTFMWQKSEFINLVRILRDNGAPIDAYGCQSHDLTDMDFTTFKNSMTEIQNQLKMPMYSSEYDIGTYDDAKQKTQYANQIKYMWERDYVAGITLWGYVYGCTWTSDGNSGIIRDGKDRPAMTWLREYMGTDAAKNAKGPFPGGKKDAVVYVLPDDFRPEIDVPVNINVETVFKTKNVDHVDFYVNNMLYTTLTEAPYTVEYVPTSKSKVLLKAVVTTDDGKQYERKASLFPHPERKPFDGVIQAPGRIEAENFDRGGEGFAFHDSDKTDSGKVGYRDDNEGVDVIDTDTGYGIGHTIKGEWLEYTVQIPKSGKWYYDICASSGSDGSAVSIGYVKSGNYHSLTGVIDIPNTGSWADYHVYSGAFSGRLNKGQQTIRLCIEGSHVNIDYFSIKDSEAGVIDSLADETGGVYEVYNMQGVYIGRIEYDGNQAPAEVHRLSPASGVYVLRNTATGASHLVR